MLTVPTAVGVATNRRRAVSRHGTVSLTITCDCVCEEALRLEAKGWRIVCSTQHAELVPLSDFVGSDEGWIVTDPAGNVVPGPGVAGFWPTLRVAVQAVASTCFKNTSALGGLLHQAQSAAWCGNLVEQSMPTVGARDDATPSGDSVQR